MKLLDRLIPDASRFTPSAWMQPYLSGQAQPWPFQTTYDKNPIERIDADFAGYVQGGLKGNGVVAACEQVRLSLFAEARFQFQRFRNGRPGDLFGDPGLSILEHPWEGGTTGDLLARMLLDADFAGSAYHVEIDGEIVRLRPDWVDVVMTPRVAPYGRAAGDLAQVGWKRVGYFYYEGGKHLNPDHPAVFLPGEVAHFAPLPDPLASWRGMSWLTPVVREIEADGGATEHKRAFFENAATPNLAVSLPREITPEQFAEFVSKMDTEHAGAENAYKTLYTGGGADVTVIGANMRELDFKTTQGAGETRIAAAAGVHPVIVGLSEGLAGSSLNAGNFNSARRLTADKTLRPLWRNVCGSLETLAPPPGPDARLWFDARDVAFLRDDAADEANIRATEAQTIRNLIDAGYEPGSVVAAVTAGDWTILSHSGLYSVQLQEAGTAAAPAITKAVP